MSNTITNNKHLKIAVGTDNFKKMATEYDVFVDKTLFIKEIIDSSEEAILITHPRRWGKTLNLDMLKTFFEPESEKCEGRKKEESVLAKINEMKGNWNLLDYINPMSWNEWRNLPTPNLDKLKGQCNKDIFVGGKITLASGEERELKALQIATVDNGKYMKYQGKNPAIFISLKDVIGDTYEGIEIGLRSVVRDAYRNHEYLYQYLKEKSQVNSLYLNDVERFKNFRENKYSTNSEEANKELKVSVKYLSELLYQYHGQKAYILVDEYDKSVNSLLENYLGQERTLEKDNFIKNVTKLISYTVCSPVGKANSALEKLILTGIFDTTQKESGSGCNNVKAFGISDLRFSKDFGFSEYEVNTIISQFKFQDHPKILDNIKDWYDGYTTPISLDEYIHLYTPWAVVNYIDDVYKEGENLVPKNYWSKSGASTILQTLFTKEKCLNTKISNKFLDISINGTYELKFDNQISLFKYNWFANSDKEEFFSYLLLNSGYLTVQRDNNIYKFSIPNAELLEEFTSIIPSNSEQCKAIIYNLQKTSHLKIVEMIKQKDAEGIKKELLESHIKCEDKSMNFNFFHLTAIFGDKNTFQALLEPTKCKEQLDFANDRVDGLKAIDYAFILKNNDVVEMITAHYKDKSSKLVEAPKFGDSILCYAYYSKVASGGTSGSLDLLKDVLLEYLGVNLAAKWVVHVGASIVNMFGSSSIEEQCNQYMEYHNINISDPIKFNSLKQFEKYLLQHEKKALVVVNSDCGGQQKALAELSYNIFENSFYSGEELKFTLCDEDTKQDL